MRRFLLIAVLCLLAVLVLAGGLTAYLIHDQRLLKQWIGDLAEEHTGRSLRIEGPLDISLGRVTTVEAHDIRFANPEWAASEDLFQAGRLHVGIDVPSLFSDQTILTVVALENCAVALERAADGRDSWTVSADADAAGPAPDDDSGALPFVIRQTRITDCRLGLRAPNGIETLDLQLTRAELGHADGDRIRAELRGALNGQPLTVDGWLAPAGVFARGGALRHELQIRAGPVQLDSSGTIADYRRLAGLELQTRFRGPDIGQLLANFQLPPVSQGPFDFRLDLDTQNELTHIDLDGDLGDLEVLAGGELDRLVAPTRGQLDVRVSGPDLRALGETFGIAGLVREPYEARVRARMNDGVLRLEQAEFSTSGDLVDVVGMVETHAGLGGSAVELRLDSDELGRWAELLHQEPGTAGPVHLECRVDIDPAGQVSIDAGLRQDATQLQLSGPVGSLEDGLNARVQIAYSTPQPGPLLHWLAGRELPAIPLDANGTIGITPGRLRFDGVRLASGPHELRLGGQLDLGDERPRGALEVTLDSPDLAALGRMLGRDDLPAGPLRLDATIEPDGPGLTFAVAGGNQNDVRLSLNGRIAELDQPLGVDAEFELFLPGPGLVHFWLPELGLPERPLTASGRLRNRPDGLLIEETTITLGDDRLRAGGTVGPGGEFDLQLAGSGPDASWLSGPARIQLPAQPFAFDTRISGGTGAIGIRALEASLGENRLRAKGAVTIDGPFELTLSASGPDASALSGPTGTNLPAQPFAIRADLASRPGRLEVNAIDATLGDSRVTGEVTWAHGEQRRLSGRLHAPLLDLTPWVAQDEQESPSPTPVTGRYVFDDTPVLALADLGLQIDGQLAIDEFRLNTARATQVEIGVSLAGRRLEVDPFALQGMAGGRLAGSFVLDGDSGVPELTVDVRGTDQTFAIGAYAGQDPATLPRGDLLLELRGRGNTHRELAASLDGRLRMRFGAGELAPAAFGFLLSDFLTELIDTLNPFSERQNVTRLDCLVVGADATAGQVVVAPVVVHAERLTVVSAGEIDLHTEKINFDFETRPRTGLGISASDLVKPFVRVGGTLAEPSMALDPAGTVVKGGLAVATAGLSILANSLANRFLSSKDPCGDAVRELEKRDGATP